MQTPILTEREREILHQLNNELGLEMSPEEQRTEQGIKIIAATVHSKKMWSEDKLHSMGIAMNSFMKICTKAIGYRNFIPNDLTMQLGIEPRPKFSWT